MRNSAHGKNAEIVSGDLTQEQAEEELRAIVQFFLDEQIEQVTVQHWFGKVTVPVSGLVDAFRRGFEFESPGVKLSDPNFRPQMRVYLGDADITITASYSNATFKFCHEDHLHVYSSDNLIVSKFTDRWLSLGYKNPS